MRKVIILYLNLHLKRHFLLFEKMGSRSKIKVISIIVVDFQQDKSTDLGGEYADTTLLLVVHLAGYLHFAI